MTIHERRASLNYRVQLEPGVWLAPGDGDPPRTTAPENAATWGSRIEAEAARAEARCYRPFENAQIEHSVAGFTNSPIHPKGEDMTAESIDEVAERYANKASYRSPGSVPDVVKEHDDMVILATAAIAYRREAMRLWRIAICSPDDLEAMASEVEHFGTSTPEACRAIDAWNHRLDKVKAMEEIASLRKMLRTAQDAAVHAIAMNGAPMLRFWLCKQFYRSKGDVPKWYIRPFAAQVPPTVGMDVCIGGMDDPRKIESICVNESGAVVCELPADVWNVGDSPSDDVSERDWPRQRDHELRGWQEWSDFSTLGPA